MIMASFSMINQSTPKDELLWLRGWTLLWYSAVEMSKGCTVISNAIILAAGLGLRLKPITDHAPKCLTEVNGIPIITNTLQFLESTAVRTCTLVTGYLSDTVKKIVGDKFGSLDVEYVINERYESTNDMYSLWLVRDRLKKGALLLEGDIFIAENTMRRVLEKAGNRSFYIAGKYNGKNDEILIRTDRDLRIRSVRILSGRCGKIDEMHYMSTGILVIQKDYGDLLSGWLDEFVQQNRLQVLFDRVIGAHVDDFPLYVERIKHSEWVEIDTVDDLRRAEKLFH
jgi:CTP:phosphocholine cytidylyltransferase-like protein